MKSTVSNITYFQKYYRKNKERRCAESRVYRGNHKEQYLKYGERAKRRSQTVNLERKKIVFAHYGNKCVCCGERCAIFLTIDHINNDGGVFRKTKIERRGGNFYAWIIKNNFPDDLQILCRNCNYGKYINGGVCPHKNIHDDSEDFKSP